MNFSSNCPCCNSDDLAKSAAILMPFMSKMLFDYEIDEITESWGLKNISNGSLYMPCKSVQCQNCGFLYSDMRFDDSELLNLYDNYRTDYYIALRDSLEPGYKLKHQSLEEGIKYKKDIESFLSEFVSNPVILDWGGFDGSNTPFVNSSDKIYIYDLIVKDLSDEFVFLDKKQLSNYKYDLIICSNVLEHVSYPKNILDEIAYSMDNTTTLYIEVPYESLMMMNEKSLKIHSLKKHWHEHINFFSISSLEKLIEQSNLKIEKFEIFQNNKSLEYASFNYLFMIACKKK